MKTPPLGLIRAFFYVAKNTSVSAASKEMNVTASAISQSIKKLENWYGVELFYRENNKLVLTEKGQFLKEATDSIFNTLDFASHEILKSSQDRTVVLSILPSILSMKLKTLVNDIRQIFPEINIQIQSTRRLSDFRYDNVDIAVRYTNNPYGQYHKTIKICDDVIYPCISNDLLNTIAADENKVLNACNIIYDESPDISQKNNWDIWLQEIQKENQKNKLVTDFSIGQNKKIITDNYFYAVELALQGQGLIMGREYLIEDYLKNKQLVPLLADKRPVTLDEGYYILHKNPANLSKQAQNVLDFLLAKFGLN